MDASIISEKICTITVQDSVLTGMKLVDFWNGLAKFHPPNLEDFWIITHFPSEGNNETASINRVVSMSSVVSQRLEHDTKVKNELVDLKINETTEPK